MDPAQVTALISAIKWIGTPIAVAFVGAMATHLIMVFRLPRRLDEAIKNFDHQLELLRIAIVDEAQERHKEQKLLNEVLQEIKVTLRRHSDTLIVHGEGLAEIRGKQGSS